ncbi:hypothetical protein HD806DRAFT_534794 [Xylariaceae sp. AK1471]|nr:hypothetical protein HD806DRAFT_534794 [Xylariaceae sp. AK1471]
MAMQQARNIGHYVEPLSGLNPGLNGMSEPHFPKYTETRWQTAATHGTTTHPSELADYNEQASPNGEDLPAYEWPNVCLSSIISDKV